MSNSRISRDVSISIDANVMYNMHKPSHRSPILVWWFSFFLKKRTQFVSPFPSFNPRFHSIFLFSIIKTEKYWILCGFLSLSKTASPISFIYKIQERGEDYENHSKKNLSICDGHDSVYAFHHQRAINEGACG